MLYVELPRYLNGTMPVEPHYSAVRRAQALRAGAFRRALRRLGRRFGSNPNRSS